MPGLPVMPGLPEGWQADYDGSRWFYKYPTTGHIQYHFPSDGDHYPDYVDASSPAPVLAPEELLESQQQIKRHTSIVKPRPPQKKRNEREVPPMSAMAQPVMEQWLEDDNDENDDAAECVFQPENFMYLGPDTYVDVSPLGEEEEEAAKRVIVGPMLGEGGEPAPIETDNDQRTDEGSETDQAESLQAELEGDPGDRDADLADFDGGTIMPVELAGADERVHGPSGWMAEMPTEQTPASRAETYPDPIELGDTTTLAPIEQVFSQGIVELASQEIAPPEKTETRSVPGSALSIDEAIDELRRSSNESERHFTESNSRDLAARSSGNDDITPVQSPEPEQEAPNGQYEPYAPGKVTTNDTLNPSSEGMSRQRQPSLQREASLFLHFGSRDPDSADGRVVPAVLASPRQLAEATHDIATRKSAETTRDGSHDTRLSNDDSMVTTNSERLNDKNDQREPEISSHPSVLRPARKQVPPATEQSSTSASAAKQDQTLTRKPSTLRGQEFSASPAPSSPQWSSPSPNPLPRASTVPAPLPRTVSMSMSEAGTGDPEMVSPMQSRANSVSSVAKNDFLRRSSTMSASIRPGSTDLTPSPVSRMASGREGLPSPPHDVLGRLENPYSAFDTYFSQSMDSATRTTGAHGLPHSHPSHTNYPQLDRQYQVVNDSAYGALQTQPQSLQRTQSLHHTQDTGPMQLPMIAEPQWEMKPPLTRIEEQPESSTFREVGRPSNDTLRQSPTLSIQPTPQMFNVAPKASMSNLQHELRPIPPPMTVPPVVTTRLEQAPASFHGPPGHGTPNPPLISGPESRQIPIHAPVPQPGWPKQTPFAEVQSPVGPPQAHQPPWQVQQDASPDPPKGKEKEKENKWTKWFKGSTRKASPQPAQSQSQRVLPAFPHPGASSQGSLSQNGMVPSPQGWQSNIPPGDQAPSPNQQWLNKPLPNPMQHPPGGTFKGPPASNLLGPPGQLHPRTTSSHGPVPQLMPSATFPGPSGLAQGGLAGNTMPPRIPVEPELLSSRAHTIGGPMGFGYNVIQQTPPPGAVQSPAIYRQSQQQQEAKHRIPQHYQHPPAQPYQSHQPQSQHQQHQHQQPPPPPQQSYHPLQQQQQQQQQQHSAQPFVQQYFQHQPHPASTPQAPYQPRHNPQSQYQSHYQPQHQSQHHPQHQVHQPHQSQSQSQHSPHPQYQHHPQSYQYSYQYQPPAQPHFQQQLQHHYNHATTPQTSQYPAQGPPPGQVAISYTSSPSFTNQQSHQWNQNQPQAPTTGVWLNYSTGIQH